MSILNSSQIQFDRHSSTRTHNTHYVHRHRERHCITKETARAPTHADTQRDLTGLKGNLLPNETFGGSTTSYNSPPSRKDRNCLPSLFRVCCADVVCLKERGRESRSALPLSHLRTRNEREKKKVKPREYISADRQKRVYEYYAPVIEPRVTIFLVIPTPNSLDTFWKLTGVVSLYTQQHI